MVNMHTVNQAEKPEEDMDVRGGGQAFDDERRIKDHDDASDLEEDARPGRDMAAEAQPPLVPPALPGAAAQAVAPAVWVTTMP